MNLGRLLHWGALPALWLVAIPLPAQVEPLTLKHAVELALTHSAAAGEINADEQHALASYREYRYQYIPQLTAGSGLGDSWGYPLTLEGIAPSLINLTAQSPLLNPAFRDYLRGARSDYRSAQLTAQDQRNQLVEDTVLTYLQLMTWEQLLPHLQEQLDDALHSQQVVDARVQAGVDSEQVLTQARLAVARAKLHVAQGEGSIQELRAALAAATGISAASIAIAQDSVPALPEIPAQPEAPESIADSTPSVLIAHERALGEAFRAQAEHRALWPTVDFASQYAVLAKFNNWLQFFPNNVFQRNNATIGVVIRVPIFNASQRAHAAAADAEALRANKQAEATKSQVSQQVLKLQDSVRQAIAAKEVSDLEYDIAKSNADAVEVKVGAGTATVPDSAQAKAEMFEKYDAAQDAGFALLKARIELLRANGGLESWAAGKR